MLSPHKYTVWFNFSDEAGTSSIDVTPPLTCDRLRQSVLDAQHISARPASVTMMLPPHASEKLRVFAQPPECEVVDPQTALPHKFFKALGNAQLTFIIPPHTSPLAAPSPSPTAVPQSLLRSSPTVGPACIPMLVPPQPLVGHSSPTGSPSTKSPGLAISGHGADSPTSKFTVDSPGSKFVSILPLSALPGHSTSSPRERSSSRGSATAVPPIGPLSPLRDSPRERSLSRGQQAMLSPLRDSESPRERSSSSGKTSAIGQPSSPRIQASSPRSTPGSPSLQPSDPKPKRRTSFTSWFKKHSDTLEPPAEAAPEQLQHRESSVGFQVLIVGDAGIGKSSLLRRFAKDAYSGEHIQFPLTFYRRTVIEFGEVRVKVQTCDINSAELLGPHLCLSKLYRDSQAVIVAFDVADAQSFKHLIHWLSDVERYSPETLHGRMIVGLKAEPDAKRAVRMSEAQEFASAQGMHYMEASARDGTNVDDVFVWLARERAKEIDPAAAREPATLIRIDQAQQPEQSISHT